MEQKAKNKLIKETQEKTDLGRMTVDRIKELAPECDPEPQEESLEALAKREGAVYVRPRRRLSPPLGVLPEKHKAQHARDWEYVKGIYENFAVPGESISFSLCLYPGDPDLLWEIPTNVPCYVPRMVARHLESVQQYHQFSYIQRPIESWQKDEFTHNFAPTGTTYRGKFRALEAFR